MTTDAGRTAGPGPGDRFPDLELRDHTGSAWRLGDALAAGPVVLVFYRGDW